MKKLSIKSYEIEVTTRCNAECPGCARTRLKHSGELQIKDLSFNYFYQIFKDIDINNSLFFFCGTLGDSMMHPEIEKIFKFLMDKNANIDVHTNGGMQTTDFWLRIAKLSKFHREQNHRKLNIRWNVDGIQTNKEYRKHVNIDKVLAHMKCFVNNGGDATWYYILFDWNMHEINDAEAIADSLGIKFYTRTAWRNKNKNYSILQDVPDHNFNKSNLQCKHKERPEIFINYDGTVWPCCYLRDEISHKNNDMEKIFKKHGEDFNLITNNKPLDLILDHPFYKHELTEHCWNENDELFLGRCFRSCGNNGSRLAQNKHYTRINNNGK